MQKLPAEESEKLLLAELKRIHLLGPIESKSLSADRGTLPCISSQCAGYTLEAELGITRNPGKEPDFHGWEVKTHPGAKRSPITLFTPSPSSGRYNTAGISEFLRDYGVVGTAKHPGRQRFTGNYQHGKSHRIGKQTDANSQIITAHLDGYNPDARKMETTGTFSLRDQNGVIICEWDYNKINEAWKKKHEKAVYVSSRRYPAKGTPTHYSYSNTVRLGKGADVNNFFRAVYDNRIYLDPAVTSTPDHSGRPKLYTNFPFRIKGLSISCLYSEMSTVDVMDGSVLHTEVTT